MMGAKVSEKASRSIKPLEGSRSWVRRTRSMGFKRRIREITRQAKGVSIQTTIAELASYMRGWCGYFGFCETPEVLVYLTRWVRLRLRVALWRQWKTYRRRRAALIALGVRSRLARNTAGSGRGPWYLARSKALSVGLSNAYFRSLGLPSLVEGC
jgi:RNA-directed DNA polymerase